MDDKNVLDISLVWYPHSGQKDMDFKASALTSENKAGRFDILPSHANFISIIYNSIVFYRGEKAETYLFKSGIIQASNNFVRLFLVGNIDQRLESRI